MSKHISAYEVTCLIGVALITAGLGFVYHPLAPIFLGCVLVYGSLVAAKSNPAPEAPAPAKPALPNGNA